MVMCRRVDETVVQGVTLMLFFVQGGHTYAILCPGGHSYAILCPGGQHVNFISQNHIPPLGDNALSYSIRSRSGQTEAQESNVIT